MTSGFEPVLHALSVEPRILRPGEIVRVAFRTRNVGSVPSPSGVVRFMLPARLEVIDDGAAGEDAEARVPVMSAGPGEDVVAEIVARVARPTDDGTELMVQAVLEAGESMLGTNVCAIVVRSRALLDGAESGTFVEALDAHTVRVRTIVTNEGDGPARDVRIVVPAPIGTAPLELRACGSAEPAAGTLDVERIDAGESVVAQFDARIIAPVGVVCADDGFVALANGARCALLARSEVVLTPHIAPLEVVAASARRAVALALCVRNDGWADARDLRVRVVLPEGLRVREGSVTVDGVPVPTRSARRKGGETLFARVEKAGGAVTVVVDRVPAQSTVRLGLTAGAVAGCAAGIAGDIVVQAGSAEPVVVPFDIEAVRDVRVRVVGAPRRVGAGDVAAIVVEVLNLGDAAESYAVAAVGAGASAIAGKVVPPFASEATLVTVDPGHVAVTTLVLHLPFDLDETMPLPLTVLVSDEGGERARVSHTLVVRERAALAGAVVRNGEDSREEPDTFDAAEAVHASHDVAPVSMYGVLVAPAEASEGAAFGVTASIDVEDPLETLVVRVSDVAGAAYVAGSTMLDRCVVLDRDGMSPLQGDGLTLRDVPQGTRVILTWAMLASCAHEHDTIRIRATAVAGDATIELSPAAVSIRAGESFPVRPAGLPYHVDARMAVPPESPERVAITEFSAVAEHTAVTAEKEVIEQPCAEPPAAPQRPAESASTNFESEPAPAVAEWMLSLNSARADAIARAISGSGGNTLVSHVLALRALLPDVDHMHDAGVARALHDVHRAVRDVFDRLSVKLRIPGFDVTVADLEDAAMRRSLVSLSQRLETTPVAIDSSFADDPLGSPDALRALVALVPARCDEEPHLAAALRAYARALDVALSRCSSVAPAVFEDALTRDAGFVLADARAAVMIALRTPAVLVGAA